MPQNIECEAEPNETILKIAEKNNVYIKSVCNGLPSCSECRVKIIEGENNIVPPFKAELNLIGTSYFVDQRRLACQSHCFGNVVVDVSEHVEKQEQGNGKKIRGLKLTKEELNEIKAVQGTLVLDEGDENNYKGKK